MANSLYLSRDVTVFVVLPNGNSYEVPVLDGFSFSQSTNSSEVTLSEMESSVGSSRRGKKQFNDSLAPAEWSFSTYVRPIINSNTLGAAVEEALWAMLVGKGTNPSTLEGIVATFATTTAVARTNLPDVDTTYKSVAGFTDGIGNGATFDVTVAALDGAVTVTLADGGQNYAVSDTITLPGSFDGSDGSDGDIVLTVSTVTTNAGTTDPEGLNRTSSLLDIDFRYSNTSALAEGDIVFKLSTGNTADIKYYQLEKAVVNEASMDFDIDGITMINWSGMARNIKSITSGEFTTLVGTPIVEGKDATNNFIRNRLTTLQISPNTSLPALAGLQPSYNITLTGGSITISNNMTYVTPEELGKVNQPLAHVTGTRAISGSFTSYIESGTNTSESFWQELQGLTNVVTNEFNITFNIGGTNTNPRVSFNMPRCHVDIPTINIEDVIALETTFNALPLGLNDADEASITYYGVVPA